MGDEGKCKAKLPMISAERLSDVNETVDFKAQRLRTPWKISSTKNSGGSIEPPLSIQQRLPSFSS
jgi:hypothetical protein